MAEKQVDLIKEYTNSRRLMKNNPDVATRSAYRRWEQAMAQAFWWFLPSTENASWTIKRGTQTGGESK